MQLLLDPLFQTHLADALDVSRTRAIRQTVHRVKDRLIFGELRDRKLAFEFLIEGYMVLNDASRAVIIIIRARMRHGQNEPRSERGS
jgi:hypothetical protein